MDESCVAILLEFYDPYYSDAKCEIVDQVNKSLDNISSGKVEMHDMLCMLSKKLGKEATALYGKGRSRMWRHHTIIDIMNKSKASHNLTCHGCIIFLLLLAHVVLVFTVGSFFC